MDVVRDTSQHGGLQALGAAAAVAVIIWVGMVLANLPTAELVNPSVEQRRSARPVPPPVPQIRDDYPLAVGWPGTERPRGPDRLHPPLVLDVCFAWRTVPSGDDRLRASTSGRDRELHTYTSAEAARAAYVDLSDDFGRCEEPTRVESLASHTAFQVLRYDDSEAEVVAVVQRGRAMVVAVDVRDGDSLATAEALADEQWSQLTAPLERLCEFTSEGCTALYG